MLLGLVGCVLSGVANAAVTFPLSWSWSNPSPHGNNIIDLTYANQLWIQVAERGQIYTSPDFNDWTPRNSHTSRALRSVTPFKDQVVIVGETGTALMGRADGDWTLIDLSTPDWLEGVAASPQLAVAVGDEGAVYTSSDGLNWQRQPSLGGVWLRSVCYGTPGGRGTFLAAGEAGFVATSTDGIRWQTQSKFTTNDLNRVSWLNGEFWALGDGGVVFESILGTSWSNARTGASDVLNAFAGTGNFRLVAGDSEVLVRQGRTQWVDQYAASNPFPPPFAVYLSAGATTNALLLCGRTGAMAEAVLGTNSDLGWFSLSDSIRNWLWDVKRFPNLYLAVGDRGTILSSVDGILWDFELPPDTATNSIFLGIGGKTNLAVAVGNAGTIITSAGEIQSVVSTNSAGVIVTNEVSNLGIYWQAVQPRPTTNDLQGITLFGDVLVVTGGGGTILTSSDGRSWSKSATPAASLLSSVEAFPGGLVAVGRDGTILTSPDALVWTARASHIATWIYRVRYLNGKLIAVGQNGTILTSIDGVQWQSQSSGATAWLNDVQWIDGTFFAVGNQGTVLSSPDAVTWTDRGTITGKSLMAAATESGLLVTVGVEGVILRSQVGPILGPITLLQYPAHPQDNIFLFSGRSGQRFTLDRSTDLTNWSPSPILQLNNSGMLLHTNTGVNAPGYQFFRAISQ